MSNNIIVIRSKIRPNPKIVYIQNKIAHTHRAN